MLDLAAMKRDELARSLKRHLQGEVRFDSTSRRIYATDASIYQIIPLGVVIPKTKDDLVSAVQIAAEMEVPIVPRGGGTSLSGQSIGSGLVIDCSKYLNSILEIDPIGRTARIQPGVVLDQLNRALEVHGLQFGPEVATASRANLGGMIGNNSAGARSVVYGKTIDHVRRLEVILSDGATTTFGPTSLDEWNFKAEQGTLEGQIYRETRRIVLVNAAEIRHRFPKIMRRVSGYNLLDLLAPKDLHQRGVNSLASTAGLHTIITGSEGTLAVIAEAEINLVPRPKARGLLVPHFSSLGAALDSLATCLEAHPSAVELMDSMLIQLTSNNLALRETTSLIEGRPAALLMVEFSGDDPSEVSARAHDLGRRLAGTPGLTAIVPALDSAPRDRLWNLRSAAMPILSSMVGDAKPITFVEDAAVAPAKLPEFAAQFRKLLQRHGTDGAFYGHASVGCLHIRPVLNLKDQKDVARMRQITESVTELVLEFGGSLSGEHGDGYLRSEWNRKMFGPTVYEAFRQIKRTFDPRNLFNPGKIVDAPSMLENLRYAEPYFPADPPTAFDFTGQGGFTRAVELCNGNGACRKLHGGTMCPSYRATRDERDTTRARANALRLAIGGAAGDSRIADRSMTTNWVHDVMDLCLMCKACKAECPSNVDVAKLKSEFLHSYYKHNTRPVGHWLMAHIHLLNRIGSTFAPIANSLGSNRWMRWLMEKAGGIDRRRSLPRLHFDNFRKWFRRHVPDPNAGTVGRVIVLNDCFTTYNEPEIGRAAVRVLERAGYEIELTGRICCGRALISKGFLGEARDLIRRQLPRLSARVADGTPILGIEPSCLLTLADEWPELVPGASARRVAASAELADAWLSNQIQHGRCQLKLAKQAGSCVLHGHCHQKALRGMAGTASALRLIPGMEVKVLDTGCCGMAGSFGFEAEHFDVSAKIAELDIVPAIQAAPDAHVVATGTSCRHQIRDLASRGAQHPLELIEASMDSV